MVYKLVTAKGPIFIILFYAFIAFFLTINDSGFSKTWSIFLMIFCIVSFYIKTEFIINQDNMNYKIRILHFVFFEKKLSPSDLNKIVFNRYGWAMNGASLKLYKGLNLRIVHFLPEDVMLQLETFAINNNVSISKSKDYLLLERREKNRQE